LKFEVLVLLLTIGILFSIISSNSVYAQLTNTLGLKITSPTTDQQVPIGNSLIVSGISSHNAVSNCQVSVIANGIKPYQPAQASGPGGANDYSKWSFTVNPKYTAIKEGENKITAKYSCSRDSSLVSFSSINVTGIPAAPAGITKQQQSVIPGNNAAKENNTTAAATRSTQSESSYIGSGKTPGHRSSSSTASTCIGSESISSSSGGSGSCNNCSNGSSCTSGKTPGHRSSSSTASTCIGSESISSSSGGSGSCNNCSNGSSCTSGKTPGHRSSREPTTQGSSPSQFNPFIFPFGPP
jgi:hypothetical protein